MFSDPAAQSAPSHKLADRAQFVAAIRHAIALAQPLAAAKIGISERDMLAYAWELGHGMPRARRIVFERAMLRRLPACGLFPLEPAYVATFAARYATATAQLDWLGIWNDGSDTERTVLASYPISAMLMHFGDQEPDRSSPSCDAQCWLPALAHKRILLVNPAARFMASRANQECFEAVWAKTGKRWFHPAHVDALEFPYGFLVATQAAYGTLDRLLDAVIAAMGLHEYDVALIGAGAMSLPLAVAAKQQGKVGIALGGHLQVLLGILGNRWRNSPEYQRMYINAAWTDLPASYVPPNVQAYENSAYW